MSKVINSLLEAADACADAQMNDITALDEETELDLSPETTILFEAVAILDGDEETMSKYTQDEAAEIVEAALDIVDESAEREQEENDLILETAYLIASNDPDTLERFDENAQITILSAAKELMD